MMSGAAHIVRVIAGAIYVAAIMLLSAACSTPRSVLSDYASRDSVQVRVVHDTIVAYMRDTAHAETAAAYESAEHSEVEFTDGGGVAEFDSVGNLLRLEGVRTLRLAKSNREQAHTIEMQSATIDMQQATIDSLRQVSKVRKVLGVDETATAEITPKASAWHTFLVGWFWTTLTALIVAVAVWAKKRIRI